MTAPEIARLTWADLEGLDLEQRLHPQERTLLEAFSAEKRRRDWLMGRVAAKRAARQALQRSGRTAPTWSELCVTTSPHGAPCLQGVDLAVSLTHGHDRAAAWALPPGESGGLPGVDLEKVRPRRLGTLRFYLHANEREPVLALPGWDDDPPPQDGTPRPRDHAAIVLWALKEAAFKALQPPRGTGLLDVGLELHDPYEAPDGRAHVTYLGKAQDRAAALGVTQVDAGWEHRDGFVLAWVHARGGRLPPTPG